MADIWTVLTQDHQEVKDILTELEGRVAPYPQVADEAHLQYRADLAEKLVMEESRHEAAEEQYFWPVVRDKLADGDRLAEKAIEQENEGKKVLDKLRKASADDPAFDELMTKFVSAGREHIAFEEEQVWPSMQATLSAEEAKELGEKFELAKKMGPTRPHPHTPASPAVLKTAGMAAAMVDKAADAVTRRGKHSKG